MNKKQQKHELLVTFMSHIKVRKKSRRNAKAALARNKAA